jgi:Tfp pilus assembly protein PilO
MFKTIISIVCFVAAGAIFFLYTQPTYDKVKASSTQIAQYDEALNKAAELQQLKQTLLSKYNTFNPADVERLQKLLPDHVDNVRLILDIDSIAGKHGMAIQNVVVSSSQSVSTSQTAIGTVSSSKQKFDSLTIKFTSQGTYENFRAFLGDMQKSLRIVDLTSLTITRTADSVVVPGSGATPLYNFEVIMRTYWLK